MWMDTRPHAAFRADYCDIKVRISEGPSVIAIPCSYFCVLNYSYNAHVIAYNIYTTFILLQSITIDDIF